MIDKDNKIKRNKITITFFVYVKQKIFQKSNDILPN